MTTVSDICSLSQETIAELLEDIEDAIEQSISCPGDTETCTVMINESNCQSSNESLQQLRRGLTARDLQQSQFELEYEIIIEKICSNGCSDEEVQSLSNELYEQVTDELKEAIDNGSMMQEIRTLSSSEIAILLETATMSGDFSDLVLPLLSLLSDYYPDWEHQSGKCLNDGSAPKYMKKNGGYYESTLQACCNRWFLWDVATCLGDSNYGVTLSGFYPNWNSVGSTIVKCLNATEVTPPGYMLSNPSKWLYDSAPSCCYRYYSWATNDCIANSDQTEAVSIGSRKFYVDWVLVKVRFEFVSTFNMICSAMLCTDSEPSSSCVKSV